MSRATSRAPSSRSPTPRSTASTSATILSDHPIAARWREVRGEGRAALIPYLTAGFPTPGASLDALRLAEAAGADVVEVGVPFSDPLADGPTIQRSAQAALEQGMTTGGVLQQIHAAGRRVPVAILTYLNPVLAYGLARFLRAAHAAAEVVVVGGAVVDVLATGGLAGGERLLREFAGAVRERDP